MSRRAKEFCSSCVENQNTYFGLAIWLGFNAIIGAAVTLTWQGAVRYAAFAFFCFFLWIPFVVVVAIAVVWYTKGIFLYKFLLDFLSLESNFWLGFLFWLPTLVGIGLTVLIVLGLIEVIRDLK